MAEPGLTLTYWDLVTEVGDCLGVGTDPTDQDILLVQRIIEQGYRQYLFPPLLPRDKTVHKWGFLSPTTTLALANADYDYDLPDDFGSMVGPFSFAAGTGIPEILSMVPEPQIRQMRAASDQSADPLYAAIRPKTYARETGTRFEALFYPTPNTVRTLTYRYNVLLEKLGAARISGTCTLDGSLHLTDSDGGFTAAAVVAGDKVVLYTTTGSTAGTYEVTTNDSDTQLTLTTEPTSGSGSYQVIPANIYPLGGASLSELLLECCLSAAEQRRDDRAGVHSARVAGLFVTAVAQDRATAPDHLGYNGDGSDGAKWGRHMLDPTSYSYNSNLLGT